MAFQIETNQPILISDGQYPKEHFSGCTPEEIELKWNMNFIGIKTTTGRAIARTRETVFPKYLVTDEFFPNKQVTETMNEYSNGDGVSEDPIYN
jgi:hypothetical protein